MCATRPSLKKIEEPNSLSKRPAWRASSALSLSVAADPTALVTSEPYHANGNWQEQDGVRIFSAKGFPLPPVNWPYCRTYNEYTRLLEAQHESSVRDKLAIYKNDYLSHVPPDATIIEIGAGAGVGISNTRARLPKATLIAAGVTPLNAENISACTELYYAPVPNNMALLQKYKNTADVVIDVFGSITYADNPVHALIYSFLLLKEGGVFHSIVSGLPHDYDASPLGNAADRMPLIAFFKEVLGVELTIRKSKVISRVNEGAIVEDFYVTITKPPGCTLHHSLEGFLALCKKADQKIGTPQTINVAGDNFGKFGSGLNITTKRYVQEQVKETKSNVKTYANYFQPAEENNKQESFEECPSWLYESSTFG